MSQLELPLIDEIEYWYPVIDYEGKYEVSSHGRVVSLNYHGTGNRGLMIPSTSNRYPQVVLSNEGKTKTHKIHRLVAQAFIPNHENKSQIDHIDGNPSNNHVSNLRWCTPKENCNFSLALENRSKAQKGKIMSDEARAKISKAQKGKPKSDEARANMSKAQKDKPKSDEARANMSKAQKDKPKSDEARANMSKAQKDKPNSLSQKWLRANEAGEYHKSRQTFSNAYNDQNHKDHAHVRALAEKYTI